MRRLSIQFLLITGLTSGACAQIQVSQEPRHHKVFENEWVRVLDVHIPPHDTSLVHKHSTPSVFLVLSKTKTGSQVIIEPRTISLTDGNIWFEGFYDTPRIHRVWNDDTVEFHVMDIELLHAPASESVKGPSNDSAKEQQLLRKAMDSDFLSRFSRSLFDVKPVHVYEMTLGPGEYPHQGATGQPILVVGLSGPAAKGKVNSQPFTKK